MYGDWLMVGVLDRVGCLMGGNMASYRYRPTKPSETKGYIFGLAVGGTVGFIIALVSFVVLMEYLAA